MTARNDDRLLSDWLHDVAPGREPEHLLGEVLARTARTRRRAAWRIPERWISMSAITSRLAPAPNTPWRTILVAAALLLGLAVGLAALAGAWAPRPAPPYGLAANGSLFYSEGGDLFAQSGPAAARTAIVTGEAQDDSPLVSLDGRHLSFLRHLDGENAEIWVVDANGSNPRQLDIGGTRPGWFEWGPDGTSAVVLEDAHPFRLTIARLGGPPATYVLPVSIDKPTFRPGHPDEIAFLGTAPGGDRGIYLVRTDGTNLRELALDPGHEGDPAYGIDRWAYFWDMSWSPAGDRLLFTTLEPAPTSPAGAGFRIHLASIDASGAVGSERILEFDPSTDDELSPVWLPTGDGFVVESVEGTMHWLSVVSVGAGGEVAERKLGIEGREYLGAQVSPDGRSLITLVPRSSGDAAVTLVDVGTGTTQILPIGGDVNWQRRAP